MRSRLINLFFVLALLGSSSCGTTTSGTTAKKKKRDRNKTEEYREDLSDYRPTFELKEDTSTTQLVDNRDYSNIRPENDVTERVNMILDSLDLLRSDVKFVEGYTIQVYTGLVRNKANQAKSKVYMVLPDSRPSLEYNQPNFKVKVGKFYTKAEAQQMYSELKKEFATAIIIPERIPLPE